ncbi:helix-turn-helix domain-containing protein [Thalassotalea sp. ND16A]|uniref:helix-turn-helix domain-containing protein n=1 Tax=Thalassotalea sp. ND16A TaxID=1535422 RepID=UPI00051CD2AE|nr:helix-turn-helix transcriptional regulator [Thalassotalea sp. ND16A]KGJ90515.1 putative transcriptional regulator, XRE family [Thalassotalea sp. ND16A]
MLIKVLRQKHLLSQELLSEKCGLSLRTIQRVEKGHRVSYASLRALASAFDINVDKLEQELYSMNTVINDYKEYPFWVRFACGRGWFSANRRELHKIEMFALFFSVFAGGVWAGSFLWEFPSGQFPLFNISMANFFGVCAVACLFCAYKFSIAIRVGDKYDLWSKLEATQPSGLFGVFKKKS